MQVPVCNPYELFEALAAKHIEGDASFSNKVHQRIIKISLFCLFKKKFRIRYGKFLVSKKVSDSLLKQFVIKKKFQIQCRKFLVAKSFGFGIKNFWWRKKFRNRYRKKVLDSVSFRFGVSSHTALR